MTQQEYENKIKELEKQIEELKNTKIEEPQLKHWKPKYDNKYYFLDSFSDIEFCDWNDVEADDWRYLIGNCFKNYEEAEEYKKQLEYTARYKNYIEERSEPINWNNNKQGKWYAEFDTNDENIEINQIYEYKTQGAIYASSEQIIENAIKEIGGENFKKYVLGVK